jgi:hypothetical protein
MQWVPRSSRTVRGAGTVQHVEGADVGVAVTNGIEAGEAKILIDPFLFR